MTIQKLASYIAKHEKKKSEVAIGDIREILKIVAHLEAESQLPESGKFSPVQIIEAEADKVFDKLIRQADRA